MSYRYSLQDHKGQRNTKQPCPECNDRKKTFTLYIDNNTGESVHPTVGICDRASSCGYHYKPSQYNQDNNIERGNLTHISYLQRRIIKPKPSVSHVPFDIFRASLHDYEGNNFITYLRTLFKSSDIVEKLISRYFIGTSMHWNGSTIFWQVDINDKIRTGKIMLYQPDTGKRVKEPYNHIQWVQSVLKLPEYYLKQCFFGEHLLKDKNKPVALVESEKTAIIASVYFPEYIWIAPGGLKNFNEERCKVLAGRKVFVFPDLSKIVDGKLSAYQEWTNKASQFSDIAVFKVSDLLERKATPEQRANGLDFADFLTKYDHKEFVQSNEVPVLSNIPSAVEPIKYYGPPQSVKYYWSREQAVIVESKVWEKEIADLKYFFDRAAIPSGNIRLDQCQVVTDTVGFIQSSLASIESHQGKKTYLPYLLRMQQLRECIINQQFDEYLKTLNA